jgi:hypothetical protein
MGTHAAIAVTDPDGVHFCVERTLDGAALVEIVQEFVNEFMGTPEGGYAGAKEQVADLGILAFDSLGTGGLVEWGKDREMEQMYFAHFDYRRRSLVASFAVDGLPAGWHVEEGYGCPHESDEEV